MDWNLLRTFMVIVQEKGITSASEKLRLTQPTISNALRRLEGHFDRRLIERRPGMFEVTPAGQRLYAECVALFNTVSGLHTLVHDQPDEVTGRIEMAFASHMVCPFLDDVLAEFHRHSPRVSFAISVLSSQEVITAVVQKDAALGVCLMHERNPKLKFEPLYRESFGYFCGHQHRLFGRRGVSMRDLRAEPYVSFKTDQMGDALWPIAMLRQQEEFTGRVIGTSSHVEEVKRLIIAGLGFGPLPIHVVEDDVRNGLLWRLPPYENPPEIIVHLIYDPTARRSRAEALLLECLLAQIDATPLERRTYPVIV
ncbi:LysR family transcriptional regulator [Mesorhizobium sp. M0700]|uniref:LysR family transcriptional regulator n=1 Tax=Mesorhizobium sp. M0700 TaxID=2956988 RepID=UPI00333D06F4